ncbi:MAG: DUF6809 family protein [Rikenellaceae bacterium]
METLKKLYRTFYNASDLPLLDALEEEQYQELKALLPPEKRKHVLRLIDTKNYISCVRTEDSFLQGLQLGLRLTNELQHLTQEVASQDTSQV